MRLLRIRRIFALLAVALAWLTAGCSHTRDSSGIARIATPLPPAFLIGPAAVLLTNTAGFSAQAETQAEPLTPGEGSLRGELLGSGPKLLFAPVRNKAEEKRSHAGNFLFIWNVAEGRGYVLSEALQAYAPVSSDLRATNLARRARQMVTGAGELVTVSLNNGTTASFEVVSASGLKSFPLRIASVSNAVPMSAAFSKIKLENVAADLFEPPEGFAKYDSPEALADELAARQRNLRRRTPSDLDQFQNIPVQERRY